MNKIYYSGNNAVDQVGQMNISGNVIPESWYKTIVSKAGKPNFHAINILADIVYWYRPVEVRDEESGVLKGYRKKFKEDLLQRSRKSIMNKFCLSSSQVDTALKCLVDIGVIFKELRIIEAGDKIFNNVLFIGINPDILHDITFPKADDNEPDRDDCDFTDPISDSDRPYTEKYDTLSDFKIEGISKNRYPVLINQRHIQRIPQKILLRIHRRIHQRPPPESIQKTMSIQIYAGIQMVEMVAAHLGVIRFICRI